MTHSEQNVYTNTTVQCVTGKPISLLIHGGQKIHLKQQQKVEDVDCESKKCPSCKDVLPIHRFMRKDRPSAPPCKSCQYCREKANGSLAQFRKKEKERFLSGEMTEEEKNGYLHKKLINSKQSSDARKKRIRLFKEEKLNKRARRCIEINRSKTKLKYGQTKAMRERHKQFWQALDNHIVGGAREEKGKDKVHRSFISDSLAKIKNKNIGIVSASRDVGPGTDQHQSNAVSVPSFRVERYYRDVNDDINIDIIIVQSRARNGVLCELDYVRCKYLIDRYNPSILVIVGKSFDGEADANRLISTLKENIHVFQKSVCHCICFNVDADEHAPVYKKNNDLQDKVWRISA